MPASPTSSGPGRRPDALHLAWLRELGARAPVVATGAGAWVAAADPAALGVAAVLPKPFTCADLRAALRRVAGGRSPDPQPERGNRGWAPDAGGARTLAAARPCSAGCSPRGGRSGATTRPP